MRPTPIRASFLLLSCLAAVPLFAAIGSDITLPVTGYLELGSDLIYRTEIVVTNHRDVRQTVRVDFIQNGFSEPMTLFTLDPRSTRFAPSGFFPGGAGQVNRIGAMRITAVQDVPADAEDPLDSPPDPNGRLEANAFIIAERPVSRGSTRQEVEAVPSTEYHAEEALFLGVRHSAGTGSYTNVGITNLHPTQAETFFVQFQFQETPLAVRVPPLTLVQVRVNAPGSSGRWVRVTPEWALGDGPPARTTPWVAYASTVDTHTGDAYSGMRVPPATRFR